MPAQCSWHRTLKASSTAVQDSDHLSSVVHVPTQRACGLAPQAALGLLQRFVHNGAEADGTPTRDRLKLIPRVVNVDEWATTGPLSGTVRSPLASNRSRAFTACRETISACVRRPQNASTRGCWLKASCISVPPAALTALPTAFRHCGGSPAQTVCTSRRKPWPAVCDAACNYWHIEKCVEYILSSIDMCRSRRCCGGTTTSRC